ncbi:MAG: S-formylglutathione hydrolase [Cohaesibacteraceae bacterium]|nr:S-formylglutathione hydrolase [Cohaesibacteraceae bacterium]MBL4875177.1 S-formylglutathione hydrolase [Cohaesibacteraceae bacterium]
MNIISEAKSHGGVQGVYSHKSEACACEMTFAVYVPPQAISKPCPVLWFLSGLTCNHANVMDKGEYRKIAAELGVIVVCPDTSPRGDGVADYSDDWQAGMGAGFYVDATQSPWSDNYSMFSYVSKELPDLIAKEFPVDMSRQSISGHSMGGHGALVVALKNPGKYLSCSAFAPIVNPSDADWANKAFSSYLGSDRESWNEYDACSLIKNGSKAPPLLIDQGLGDQFLESGLRPERLQTVCDDAGIPIIIRMQDGYDHSYNFISSFMEDHLRWHALHLAL